MDDTPSLAPFLTPTCPRQKALLKGVFKKRDTRARAMAKTERKVD